MSMELDTVLHEVTRPPTESCEERVKLPNSEPKRLKSEPELGSEQKPKPSCDCDSDDEDPEWSYLVSKYEDDIEPYFYLCDKYFYKNKAWKEIEKADADYIEQSRNLSPYDAIPRPYNSMLVGGSGGVQPIDLNYDDDRTTLKHLSKLALNYYNTKNNNQDPTFVFHDLVKATFDVGSIDGTMYYITFQAKIEEDPSDSPAITTFQAQVWDDDDHDKSPDVIECAIKI